MAELDFINLVKNSPTMSAVLRQFGMENKGNNYQTCRKRIQELKLDTSHFLNRIESSRLTRNITLEELNKKLIVNSIVNRFQLKKYLIIFNLLKYECYNCKNNGAWNNKKLSLQLEHKNGISNDNRLENLTFLCPNCHSQTDTYAGKKHKKISHCEICDMPKKYSKINKSCVKCKGKSRRKYIRPSKEDLEKMIAEMPILQISKRFDTTDNTIRKWATSYGINTSITSKFSRINRIAKLNPIARIFPSKYLYVSFVSSRNKWLANIKDKKSKKSLFAKRFNSELEAAESIAKYFNSTILLLRT